MNIVISCSVLKKEVMSIIRGKDDTMAVFLPASLHRTPLFLSREIKRIIDNNEVGKKILLYGSCCFLRSYKKVTPVPGVSDCFDLLLGITKRREIQEKEPGTYLLSAGWIQQDGTPFEKFLSQGGGFSIKDYKSLVYSNYKRLLYVKSLEDDNEFRERAMASAEAFGWIYEEVNAQMDILRGLLC